MRSISLNSIMVVEHQKHKNLTLLEIFEIASYKIILEMSCQIFDAGHINCFSCENNVSM